ncbi:hypothetical protein CP01DC11_1195 [Chlamydia psittaci 01DC11]|nr:hypothetical protein CP01DC11_1195 [Chlamydia psittaci 01DC11]
MIRLEAVWSRLSRFKPVLAGLVRFESGLSRSKPGRPGLVRNETVKTGLSQSKSRSGVV